MTIPSNVVRGFLGIDVGTQGLSVIFTHDDEDLTVAGTAAASYDLVPDLPEGCYEQRAEDWEQALSQAMQQLHQKMAPVMLQILAIGISGQMHGEVLVGPDHDNGPDQDTVLSPVRLWCDARNADTAQELTDLMQTKIPKRATAARFLWTARHRPDLARSCRHLTTPAGWMAYCLTGQFCLGVGDAAGVFPIDPTHSDRYHPTLLPQYDQLLQQADPTLPSLAHILPTIKRAGEDAGYLTPQGAALLHLDPTINNLMTEPIPVAPAEGDQVAALAGSLIGETGSISCSFGTSVVANVIAADQQTFRGVSPAVDHFCAADGKPIHMVWLRNGTTFLNTIVQTLGQASATTNGDEKNTKSAFDRIMPLLLEAPADCGGLMALPFMDDEPGLEVAQGGSAMIVGWNAHNGQPGHVAKAALLSTMFNLRSGCRVLEEQGVSLTELVLTGGLTQTPACGQILADVFDTPVTLHLDSASEGSAWGAAVMALFRYKCSRQENNNNNSSETATDYRDYRDWTAFLQSLKRHRTPMRFEPHPETVAVYRSMWIRHEKLVHLQAPLTEVIMSS